MGSTSSIFDPIPSSRHCLNTCSPELRSRGSTLRSLGNPMGDETRPSVKAGNLLASRCLVLCLIACAWFVLEQPRTSIMEYHKLFQAFLKLVTTRKFFLKMSHFGGPTEKPTILYSSSLVPTVRSCLVFGDLSLYIYQIYLCNRLHLYMSWKVS